MATSERVAAYDFQKYDQFIQLTLNPPLTEAPWGDIDDLGKNVLNELESFRTPSVLVDLTPLNYMGSAMVALIVRIWKATKAKSGQMVVLCGHPLVLKVISLAGLDKVWKIVPSPEAAYRELKVKAPVANGTATLNTPLGNGTSSHSGMMPGPTRSGVIPGPSRSGVMVNPSRSGVAVSPLYNSQGALIVGRDTEPVHRSPMPSRKTAGGDSSGATIAVAVLITVSILSLIVGGLGLALLLKVAAVPKSVSLALAYVGAGLAVVSALGAAVVGEMKSRILGAICALAGMGLFLAAILNR